MGPELEEELDDVAARALDLAEGEPHDLLAVALGEVVSSSVPFEVAHPRVPAAAIDLDDHTPFGDEGIDTHRGR